MAILGEVGHLLHLDKYDVAIRFEHMRSSYHVHSLDVVPESMMSQFPCQLSGVMLI